MAKHVLGIDLGTTNSCMATLEHGQPKVLENAEGGRTTPSVVAYLDDSEKLVGPAARRQAVTNPTRTIFSVKRFMGRKLSEVSDEQEAVPYSLVAGPNDAVRVLVESEELAPEQLSALVLAKLKADTEAYLGEDVEDAVITVPAYFNDAQRQATKDAASIAGLNVLRIINEPTAAALAYGFAQSEDEDKTVLVFDLGGGTFDVSVLDIGDGVYDVQATKGDNHLGGDDFDKLLVDWMVTEFKREHGVDLSKDPTALQRLQDAAEKAKMELSSAARTHISLAFITAIEGQPAHLDMHMSRAEFEQLCEPLLDRLVGPTEQAMTDADLSPSDLDAVLLVGGMTRMPAIHNAVKRITGLDPLRGVNPDEAVAAGAAIQAGVLAGDVEDVLLVDVTPVALGIETKGGVFTKLVQANTTVPARVTETFTTAEDNQPSVEVHVLQGEREMAKDNRSIGRVVLLGIPPARAGLPQVEVTFDINTDGILHVSAQDLGTGAVTETTIKDSTGLDSGEVERMKAEAAEYAERDRAEREAAEARNNAETLRDQARRLLRDHAEEMPVEMRESVEKALGGLDTALRDNADQAALQTAVDGVTEVVQSFSERLYSDDPEVPEADEQDGEGEEFEAEIVEDADDAELESSDEHPHEPDRLEG